MTLLTKSVSPFVVPSDHLQLVKSQARIGATPTADTDASWVSAAWGLVEVWTQRLWLRGVNDYREGLYEFTVAPIDGDLPVMLSHRNTPTPTIHVLNQWDDTTAAYVPYSNFRLRPGGRWRPLAECEATYRLEARATPPTEIPGRSCRLLHEPRAG